MQENVDTARFKDTLMLKRTISGACFVAIIVGFFLLRQYVDGLGVKLFQILSFAFCSLATFEVARAVKPYSAKGILIPATIFGIIFVPTYCLTDYLFMQGFGYLFAIDLCLMFVLGFAIYTFAKGYDIKTFAISSLPIVYPALLILAMLVANDVGEPNGFLAMLLIFVISPCSDTMAYLVGMTYSKIKKGKVKKLCPKLSPNKTVAGAIGGVVGGVLGSILVYFIFRDSADLVNFFSPIFFFILIGLVGSVLTILGDLLESLIKRRTGIKDMGKIMPGHGGAMDRIDGMSLCAVFVCIMFLVV